MELFFALLIVASTLVTIVIPFWFFRSEKKKCQKYGFYRLRDEVIWKIATSDDVTPYLRSYERVNDSIDLVHHFNLRSFLRFMTSKFAQELEEVWQERNGKLTPKNDIKDFSEFDERSAELLISIAKRNSWRLRLALSPLGYKLIRTPLIISGVVRFLRSHPELSGKLMPQLKAVSSISFLAESIRIDHHHNGGMGPSAT